MTVNSRVLAQARSKRRGRRLQPAPVILQIPKRTRPPTEAAPAGPRRALDQ